MTQETRAPKVSVCVVTYNQAAYIGQCLHSLVDQVTDFDFEVIVGDDCSTDGTRAVLLDFVQRYPKILRALFHERNVGASRNYLEVHGAATGDYVAHVDGDDYALPGKLQAQADVLDSDPGCTAVWHRCDFFDDRGGFCSGTTANLSSFERGRVMLVDAIRLGYVAPHSSLMYRRSARVAYDLQCPVMDLLVTWDTLAKGHGHVLDKVLGRFRVASANSLQVTQRHELKKLGIWHASNFLAQFPQYRRDFMVWALCCALVEAKNLHRSALNLLAMAWRIRAPVSWNELKSSLQRQRAIQVRWRQRHVQGPATD